MNNLIEAVGKVMDACKGIDKSMTVGTGNSSYKGVSDKDVKLKIGEAMRNNGLAIFPIKIEPKSKIEAYETTDYKGNPTVKQTVFVEVITTYRLMHSSGEFMDIQGYGHGTDPQDKAAGKATTYAMKYALLYTFMVATGHIDDTDATHSDDIKVTAPPKKKVLVINRDNKTTISAADVKKASAGWNSDKRGAVEKWLTEQVCFTDEQWKQITGTDWVGGDKFSA